MRSTKRFVVIGIIVVAVIALLLAILAIVNMGSQERDPDNFSENFRDLEWSEIEELAVGQTVFWYMWGGSEAINTYVTDYLGARLLDEYGVTLELVPLADTADAVNKIVADNQAGNDTDGAIDFLWINGENFRTLREGDLLFGPFADVVPNRQYIAPDSTATSHDYGYPIDDYESPYGAAQFVVIYNSEYVPNPPATLGGLFEWARANPGRFTYQLLPDFVGSAFVRHVFYANAGDVQGLLGGFDQQVFDTAGRRTWAALNDIEPFLWRGGETYPESQAALELLFANGEVWFDLSYNPAKGGTLVESGQYPESTRTYVFDEGTISNHHYVAIPYNSPHKAGAMVAANLILDPLAQLEKNKPEVWGDPTVLSLDLIPADVARQFRSLSTHPSAASADELNKGKLPEVSSRWVEEIERAWTAEVLQR